MSILWIVNIHHHEVLSIHSVIWRSQFGFFWGKHLSHLGKWWHGFSQIDPNHPHFMSTFGSNYLGFSQDLGSKSHQQFQWNRTWYSWVVVLPAPHLAYCKLVPPKSHCMPISSLCWVNNSIKTVWNISNLELWVVNFFIKIFACLCKKFEELEMRRHMRHFKVLEEIVLYWNGNDFFAFEHDLSGNNDTKDQPLLMEGIIFPLIIGNTYSYEGSIALQI